MSLEAAEAVVELNCLSSTTKLRKVRRGHWQLKGEGAAKMCSVSCPDKVPSGLNAKVICVYSALHFRLGMTKV